MGSAVGRRRHTDRHGERRGRGKPTAPQRGICQFMGETAMKSRVLACLAGLAIMSTAACTSNSESVTSSTAETSSPGASSTSAGSAQSSANSAVGTSAPPASSAPGETAGSEPGETAGSEPGTVPSTPQPTEPATTQGGGNINETVPEGTVVSLSAVPIAQTADVGSGVSVAIASIERIQGEARLPGEIAGPALAIKVNVVNGTNEPLSLSAVYGHTRGLCGGTRDHPERPAERSVQRNC